MGARRQALQALPDAGDHHRRLRRVGRRDQADHERAVERGRKVTATILQAGIG